MNITIKTPEEIQIMREGGKILATILKTLKKEVKEGISTAELNQIALNMCAQYNVQPSFLGYGGFPGAICASVNEEIVHGIPSDKKLKKGDLISIDFGVYHKGLHTDSCITVPVGEISPQKQKLLKVTKEALNNAISLVRDGVQLGDISNIIQETAEKNGFNIVKNLTGHGIGENLHEEPQVLNFGKKGTGIVLKKGMTIAIEPIITIGSPKNYTLSDDWTIVTEDGSLSGHFEHTMAVTQNGADILTT